MNRELKFRAWVIGMSQMFYHEEINYGHVLDYKEPHDDIELMQFTGLKDKNGKEIYEGDIVSHLMNDYTIPLSVVSFKDGMFVFIDDEDTTELIESLDYCEVIGNIYENPELLNQKI